MSAEGLGRLKRSVQAYESSHVAVLRLDLRALLAENERLRATLDTIERRLVEGYAPGMPWSNEDMALGIVREEKAKALKVEP